MRVHHSHFLLAIAFAILSSAVANEAPTSSIEVAQHEVHGDYLTDAEGFALYVFAQDEQGGPSSCEGDCLDGWLRLIVAEPGAGDGTDPALLGVIEREGAQITYDGWPLYRHVGDELAGDTHGLAIDGRWSLIAPDGTLIAQAEGAIGGDSDPESGAEGTGTDLMAHGESVYSTQCAFCHGDAGEGGEGSRLANHSGLGNDDLVLRQVMRGGDYMPAFGNLLTDEDIAAVSTYIRNSWGNEHGEISVSDVADAR